MEGKKRDKIHKNASMEEVKKAQYNHNCHVQGFLGVALKTLSPPSLRSSSLHIPTTQKLNIFERK